jgi:myo-inositol-1(or 4)-monophosphatase
MPEPDPAAFIKEVAVEAGGILMSHYARLDPGSIRLKGDIDLVTEADLESERHIVSRIRAAYPGHTILAEEEVQDEAGACHWIVDPLDGTTNFAHSLPLFAVSMAFVRDGRTECAAVYAPRLDELFFAERGRGATLNGKEVRVSNRGDLRDCVLATGFYYQRRTVKDNNVDAFCRFILDVRGLRRMGVAAVDLGYVACGRLDGFWEPHLSPHDVAAGALIVQEAGGRVTDYLGGEDFMGMRRIVASNGLIHDTMLSRLELLED